MSLTIYLPDMAEFQEVRQDVERSSLGEALGDDFFSKIAEQIRRFENDESNELNSLYSLLQPPEQRKKFIEFVESIKPKIGPREWGDLCEKLSSGEGLRAINAAFEVTIAGNLLAQLPPDKVSLYAPTKTLKNVDVCLYPVDRPVYLETTVLGESKENSERRKAGSGIKVWMGDPFTVFGGRVARVIATKGRDQFLPEKPNVLAISVFDVWDNLEPAQERLASANFENIGLLLPFGRRELMLDRITRPDPSCRLTPKEEEAILELLSGEKFFPIGYV